MCMTNQECLIYTILSLVKPVNLALYTGNTTKTVTAEELKMRKVGFFDIYVEDMDRAQTFYETVLDVSLSAMGDPNDTSVEMRMFGDDFSSHGAGGALVKVNGARPGVGGTMVYFTCDDCAVEAGRVAQAGGQIIKPKYPIGEHGFVSLATDTEGNMIGFHSMR